MAATQRYVGAQTPLGKIVQVSDRLFNPEVTVQTKDGSTAVYRLPFLIALGARPAAQVSA